MIQSLEPRRLMAVTAPTLDADTEVVTVSGTDAGDFITITRRWADELLVTLGGQRFTFDAARVSRVEVFAGDGNDRVIGGRAGVPLTVDGEAGNDVIQGGDGDDQLDGGAGRDSVRAGDGNDTLAGGTGDDSVFGGDGDDVIADAAGNDYLVGNDGNDLFDDQDGVGTASGGAGIDTANVVSARYRTVGIENINSVPGATDPVAEPALHLYARRADNGIVTVFVEATHLEGGFDKSFGPARRFGRTFETTVVGRDVAPNPGDPRTPMVDVDTQPYELGRLSPGTYVFNVRSRGQVRSTLTFEVTPTGLAAGTPTDPGPNGAGTVLPPRRVQGTVVGPDDGDNFGAGSGNNGGGGNGGGGTIIPPMPTDERPPQPDTPTLGVGNGWLPPMGVSPVVAPGMR